MEGTAAMSGWSGKNVSGTFFYFYAYRLALKVNTAEAGQALVLVLCALVGAAVFPPGYFMTPRVSYGPHDTQGPLWILHLAILASTVQGAQV